MSERSEKAWLLEASAPDFGALTLGPSPNQTLRIMGLVKAGHSYRYICELGYYQKSWGPLEVQSVLRNNRVRLPDAPDPGPKSRAATSYEANSVLLTSDQLEILYHLCQGKNDVEIAEAVHMPINKVGAQMRDMLTASEMRDRLMLATAVLSGRLVPVESARD